ncbi:MAG: acetyl-coenzyme A synthetase, partial [Actinobacteria bacterium]|nr:acetyl-coenzyme A synthetase [Actinomycetota bacterium]
YKDTYWSRFEGQYFAGDGAKWDDEHVLWLLGRVDDVMNISGHRISTTEVESALVSHPKVAEAAVVGAADPTTGQAIVAFVTVKGDVTDDLPKTRSCKIMRRLLRDVAEKRELGDVTTLLNAPILEEIRAKASQGADKEE